MAIADPEAAITENRGTREVEEDFWADETASGQPTHHRVLRLGAMAFGHSSRIRPELLAEEAVIGELVSEVKQGKE